jgi:hypothetical protein
MTNALPAFAGVCSPEESRKIGLPVAECVRRLRNLAYVQQRLAYTAAAHLSRTPEWEVKAALALHAWYDAEHASMLRRRLVELRENEHKLDEAPSLELAAAMEELLCAEDTLELLTGIYRVARPLLLELMGAYLGATNPLADHVSCRALKRIAMDENEATAWGQPALAALLVDDDARKRSTMFAEHLEAFFAAAGLVPGKEGWADLPPRRARQPFQADVMPRRDESFHGVYDTSIPADTIYADESRPIEERNLALLFKRVREMDVPETVAGILAQSPAEPWEYHAEMHRQMWDEARHALLGQAALEQRGLDWRALPINVTFSYKLARYLQPRERHLLLYAIEQSLMPAGSGKKYEWQIAARSGDQLSTNFHDFDWADEVLHAAIGRRQLRRFYPADQQQMIAAADELVKRIAKGLEDEPLREDVAPPDWWQRFAQQALGRPVPPVPQTHLTEWRPVSS